MSAKDPSQPTPLPVVFGLAVTGCLLYVLSLLAQSWLRLATLDALHPGLPLLAYVILFYIAATFVSHGTRQRPEQLGFVSINVAVHAGFLGAGWLLFRSALPLAWLLPAVGFSAVLHAGTHVLARLRERSVARLLQSPSARYEGAVAWCFGLRSSTYMALPFGAAVAPLLGAFAGADGAALVRHCVAGAFGGAACAALRHALDDGRWLARAGVEEGAEATPRVCARSLPDAYALTVYAPTNPPLRAEAVRLARLVRETVLLNQLQRLMLVSACLLVVAHIELGSTRIRMAYVLIGGLALVSTLLPYAVGQLKLRSQPLPAPTFWPTLLGAVLLGTLAALCAAPLVTGLLR